jgi:hypothetical protein
MRKKRSHFKRGGNNVAVELSRFGGTGQHIAMKAFLFARQFHYMTRNMRRARG